MRCSMTMAATDSIHWRLSTILRSWRGFAPTRLATTGALSTATRPAQSTATILTWCACGSAAICAFAAVSERAIADGAWHHVAVSQRRPALHFFVDGHVEHWHDDIRLPVRWRRRCAQANSTSTRARAGAAQLVAGSHWRSQHAEPKQCRQPLARRLGRRGVFRERAQRTRGAAMDAGAPGALCADRVPLGVKLTERRAERRCEHGARARGPSVRVVQL